MAEKSLGWLVNVWLALMIIGNFVGIVGSFAMGFMDISEAVPSDMPYLMAGLSVANIILIIFLLQRQKWAFYGLCVTYFASVIVPMVLFRAGFFSITGLIAPLVLYLLLIPKWKLLR